MERIRPTFGNDVGNRTTTTTVFGAIRIRENGDFPIRRTVVGSKGLSSNRIVVVVLTVDEKVVGSWPGSIHHELGTVSPQTEVAVIGVISCNRCRACYASLRQYQRDRIQICIRQ